ncbi:MAG: serine/threonine protein phosphatase [Nitrospiraceae bacterium]|nr:MAG: serine/threonine protein phosphatase [Nitrospiraceae bacterium]
MVNKVFTGNTAVVYAAGDLHGDYQSYETILNIYEKNRKDALLVFLGDYADRGLYGVEIITELSRLLDTRDDIVALKGNHEIYRDGRPAFYPCDLINEADRKVDSWAKFYQDVMLGFLSKLYIAAIIGKVLFIHAGISSNIHSARDLSNPENEKNLLWSDPFHMKGEHKNPRGSGLLFGEDITQKTLSLLGLKMIVRSHEPYKAAFGPYVEHEGKIVTVNSCTTYGGLRKPFILRIDTATPGYEPIYLNKNS